MIVLKVSLKVLIESDWNLKEIVLSTVSLSNNVLIESDWNLKWKAFRMKRTWLGINRIRLEFKAACHDGINTHEFVLIESDWNLKHL